MTPNTGDWSASADVLGQFFYILLIFAIVILLFLFCARRFASLRYGGKGRNLRVIETCQVGAQSCLQIVRAGGRVFLIGVTKDRVSLVAEITGEPLNIADNATVFENFLKKKEGGA
ncbi:MAG: flagellar biosynthetic protein FliO [Clostridiales bacterium]|jgi:flagellar biogenesis protein FliO|nr:flagellar biosynthetic protein FliO [Clostridiales bacterium]